MKCPFGGATLDAHIFAASIGHVFRETNDGILVIGEWFMHWTTTLR